MVHHNVHFCLLKHGWFLDSVKPTVYQNLGFTSFIFISASQSTMVDSTKKTYYYVPLAPSEYMTRWPRSAACNRRLKK